MKTFQVDALRNDVRTSLMIEGESKDAAKQELKQQGFAVVEIHEVADEVALGQGFFFEASIHGEAKSGKIQSDDILQAYIKLREDLWYDVEAIYFEKDADEGQKKKITLQVERNYESHKTKQRAKFEKVDPKKSSYAQKKVKKIKEALPNVESLLKRFLTEEMGNIQPESQTRLVDYQQEIKKLYTTSNEEKLRETIEDILLLIGEEKKIAMQEGKTKNKSALVREENKILKKISSSKRIYTVGIGLFGAKKEDKKEEVKKVVKKEEPKKQHKNTFSYYQAKEKIKAYKELLKNTKSSTKKLAIKQNIEVLGNRLKPNAENHNSEHKKTAYWELISTIIAAVVVIYSVFSLVIWSIPGVGFRYSALVFVVIFTVLALIVSLKNRALTAIGGIVLIVLFIFLQVNFG